MIFAAPAVCGRRGAAKKIFVMSLSGVSLNIMKVKKIGKLWGKVRKALRERK